MGRYIIKRILYILLVFIILSFTVFMVYNMLPVDKAMESARAEVQANKHMSAEEREDFFQQRYEYWQNRYGTNGTKVERYLR